MQHRGRQGQRTHGTALIHTVQFSNTFSILSDPATAHLLHPQRHETPPPAPSQSGPVSPPHVPGATQAAALGRPHAKRTRHARSHIHDCDYIGTLNTRNLHTRSMTEVRVGALSQLMETHCIGIMAVQETKLAGHLPEFDVFGVQYMGPPAHLQHGVPTGGTGFFVRDAIVTHVTYLGTRPQSRRRSSPKFAPVWLKVFGPTPEQDIHVASVYLPCAGCSREQYADALSGLQDDVEYYLAHSHTIYLAGDFNARVGCRSSPAIPPDLRGVAPLHGEATVNANGRALLQFCRDNNADFVSGRSITAPTCIGHGRNGTTLEVLLV